MGDDEARERARRRLEERKARMRGEASAGRDTHGVHDAREPISSGRLRSSRPGTGNRHSWEAHGSELLFAFSEAATNLVRAVGLKRFAIAAAAIVLVVALVAGVRGCMAAGAATQAPDEADRAPVQQQPQRDPVDEAKLKAVLGDDTAGLMLTNPNTVGIFDENILEITRLVHEAGGLCYYDGANLNAVMGVVRPGDMGFDCIHLNLHKTFSTPHGGGGPGAGAVGCKDFLKPYLPHSATLDGEGHIQVRAFAGNFLVVVRALAYLLTLGREGVPEAAQNAVLNANYLMRRMAGTFRPAFDRICMHEFVLDLSEFKKETGVSALDVAKSLIDRGIHPPTMYFPLIVHEALMLEPTETEGPETLDHAADVLKMLAQRAYDDPQAMHDAPHHTVIGRPDEVKAARHPVLRWTKA